MGKTIFIIINYTLFIMKKTAISLLLILIYFKSFSQLEVYTSYEDFKNNKPQIYADVEKIEAWSYFIEVKADKKIKLFYKDIWGFKFKNTLFRTVDQRHIVALINKNKLAYWENGMGIVETLSNPDKKKVVITDDGTYYLYLSKAYDSEIYKPDDFRKLLSNPIYDELIGSAYDNYPDQYMKAIKGKFNNKYYALEGYSDGIAVFITVAKNGLGLDEIRKCVSKFNNP